MALKSDAVPLAREINNLSLGSSGASANSRLATENVTSSRSINSNSNNIGNSDQLNLLESSSGVLSTLPPSSSTQTSSNSLSERNEISYQRISEDFSEGIYDRRWQSVNRFLNLNYEGNSIDIKLWKKLAMSLFNKIEEWRELKILAYKPSVYDFCVIHTDDEIDIEIVSEFMRHLDLEGLIGISLANIGLDENSIEASTKILNGSTKIFVLNTPSFIKSGMHRLQYQESLVNKLYFQAWKTKLIPLRPSPRDLLCYKEKYPLEHYMTNGFSIFGLGCTKGITLGDRSKTVNQVRTVLTTDIQQRNDMRRTSDKADFMFAIDVIKEKKCEQLAKGLKDLKHQFNSLNFSTEYLAQLCIGCEELYSWSSPEVPEQVIRLENCREVSIGPSFNFNLRHREDEGFSDI